jgi:hypothetical protein
MAIRRTQFARGGSGRKDVRSLNNILTDYKRFVGVVESEAKRIMQTAAQMVLDETIPLTPLDTGALRSSGRAEAVETPKGVAGVVSFGGQDYPVTPTSNAPTGIVAYAIKVHEDLERHYAVGGPKYLERGGIEAKDKVEAYVLSELKKIKP